MSVISDGINNLMEALAARPGLGLPSGSSWSIASVVAEVCLRAGIPVERMNLETLEGSVEGLPYSPSDGAFAVIEALSQIFLFDASNYDGILNFVPRGGDVVAVIELDDLVDSGKESMKLNRKDAITVPRVLHLEYFDIDGGLSADKQTSDRSLDSRSVSEAKIQTAVLMGADDAARSVVINHKISTEEQRGTYEFSLPEQYIWLAVGDCISLDSQRLRIIEIEIDDGLQNYKAVFDRRSAYQTTVQGVPVERPIDPPSLVVAGTVLHFIDSHILRDADDRLGFYVAVTGAGDGWSGARVELSIDGGETFVESVDAYTDADVGVLDAPLPSHPVWYPDARNALRVSMVRADMEFESADLRGMQNRQNLALVGDEIVNLGDADEVEPGIWEFTHLLRGRRGSPVSTHPVGTRFVSLERSQLWFIDAELYMLASELTFRATSFGGSESDTVTAVFAGRSQIERSPSYLTAKRSGGELIVNWQGVGRLGGGAHVSMGAHFTGFSVAVNAGPPVPVQQPPYSVADPGPGAVISVRQLNRFTGPGPASEIVV